MLGRDCLPALELKVWYPNPSRRVASASRLFHQRHRISNDALAPLTSYASSNMLLHPSFEQGQDDIARVAIVGNTVPPHTNGVLPVSWERLRHAHDERLHTVGGAFHRVR
jgi:hypothetical protein